MDYPLGKNKAYIIAEIGNNHEGDVELAKNMIELAAKAGCDAVKFQTIKPELLVSLKNEERVKQLKKFELSIEDYFSLSKTAQDNEVDFLSTPFYTGSVAFLNDLVPAFKISSGDLTFYQLLEEVAKTAKPIFLSTGMSNISEIEQSIIIIEQAWKEIGIKSDLFLLHCVSSYPTLNEQANLSAISTLKSLGYPVGYSDHTIGINACIIAVSLGARIIEKHFTISKNHSSFRDHQLSADPEEMTILVNKIRDTEILLGNGMKVPMPTEISSLKTMRRNIFSKGNIEKDTILNEQNIIGLRSDRGIPTSEINRILGKKTKRFINDGEILNLEDII